MVGAGTLPVWGGAAPLRGSLPRALALPEAASENAHPAGRGGSLRLVLRRGPRRKPERNMQFRMSEVDSVAGDPATAPAFDNVALRRRGDQGMVSSVAPPFQTVYWPDLGEAAAQLGVSFLFWHAAPPPGAKMQPAGPPVFLGPSQEFKSSSHSVALVRSQSLRLHLAHGWRQAPGCQAFQAPRLCRVWVLPLVCGIAVRKNEDFRNRVGSDGGGVGRGVPPPGGAASGS